MSDGLHPDGTGGLTRMAESEQRKPAKRWPTILVGLALLFSIASSVPAASSDSGQPRTQGVVPTPRIDPARGGTCPESPAFMRRNHMDLLKHQRDDTLRVGDRRGQYSLKECISCHASQTTNSVAANSSNFCQSCHAYAAVRIDCFECHATQPQVKP